MRPDSSTFVTRFLGRQLSRRTALRTSLALGAGAATLRGRAALAQSTPASGQPSSLADQRVAVQVNIDRFRRTSPDALLELVKSVKTRVAVRDRPTVPAPLEYATTPDGLDNCYLARSDDPANAFPSLSPIVPVVGREDNGVPVAVFNMEAIYLGRTTHPLTSNAGDFQVEIGYLGLFAGDPAAGSPPEQAVIPAFLGWHSADGSLASSARVLVRETDAGQPEFPFDLPPVSTSLEMVGALDAVIGAGVAQLQVSQAAVQKAEAGWPDELYAPKYLAAEADTTNTLWKTLNDLDLTRAAQDGYSLWTQATDPKQIGIFDAFPDLATTSPAQLVGKLPASDAALALDEVTPDALVAFPRILAAFISPTSAALAT